MPLATGTRLGVYEVIAPLGAGGMGEVYRAHDTRLRREVALKLLPASFVHDPGRVARFEREARVLARLNHPHIAAIYGFENTDGLRGLVLELVEGETLADRLRRGPVPLTEALTIAWQIADALDAAHEKGIVHRDLKPANVQISPEGRVKVLDFGLAKTVADGWGGVGAADAPGEPRACDEKGLSESPTLTLGGTKEGIVLGTTAYMSPEQARGQPVDRRSDIWALGCLLYEMLTGNRSFARDTVTDTLAAIVNHDVKWAALPESTPAAVVKLLRRCLAKDRRQRLSDAADVRLELDDVLTAPAAHAANSRPGPSPGTSRGVIGVAVGAIVVVSALPGIGVWLATRPALPRVTRTTIIPPASAPLSRVLITYDLSVSADGGRVVYASANNALVVRSMDELSPTTLSGVGIPRQPIFSPDGQWIAYVDRIGGGLKKVPSSGGPAVTILSNIIGGERGACWGPDGTIIFATDDSATGLLRVPVVGGAPEVLTTPDRAAGELDHLWPELLPGGAGVLFTIPTTTGGTEKSLVAVLDLHTRARRVLLRGGTHAHYVAPGYLIYGTAAGALRAVRFDPGRLEVVGTPVPVVEGVAITNMGGVDASVAAEGTLVYRPAAAAARQTLVWVNREGREEPVGAPPRAYGISRLSPDGHRIAFSTHDRELDIWLWDLEKRRETRLTVDSANDYLPVWTPDGRRLAWASGRDGPLNVYMQAADGTGTVERLTESPYLQRPTSFTPDGTRLILTVERPGTPVGGLALLKLDTRTVSPLADPGPQSNFGDFQANGEISPDGRWLAYDSYETGRLEIFVRPFPEVETGKWQVSSGGGQLALWARAGRELFYRSDDGAVMAVRWDASPGRFDARPPVKLIEGHRSIAGGFRDYDVTPDGKRFLMIKDGGDESSAMADVIVVVEHWEEELKRLLPPK